jgi:diguanylate cyclase (GGDEF)-like protein/PAS domain S-box-containing protein
VWGLTRIRARWRRWSSRGDDALSLGDLLLERFPGVVMFTDAHGVIERVNPGFESHAGHAREALLGRRLTTLDIDPLHGEISHALAYCVSRRRPWQGVLLCRRADGRLSHQDTVIQPLGEAPGEPLRLLVVQHDVSAMRQRALQDHTMLQRLEGTLSRLPAVVFEARQDPRGRLGFLYLGDGLQRLTGLSPQTVMAEAERLLELLPPEDRRALIATLAQSAVSLQDWHLEFRLRLPRGERWLEGRATPRRRREGDIHWDGVLLDVTERKQAESRIEELVGTDMLTGALNRRAFFDQGEAVRAHAARQGRPVPLAMLDLDHFKALNDAHGHGAGDMALQSFAMTCRDCLRPYDLFARIGGEEFVVMLVDSEPEQAWGILDRLRRAVEALELEVDGELLHLTVSLGLTLVEPSGSLDGALSRADGALYRAKREGRNRICGSPEVGGSLPPGP